MYSRKEQCFNLSLILFGILFGLFFLCATIDVLLASQHSQKIVLTNCTISSSNRKTCRTYEITENDFVRCLELASLRLAVASILFYFTIKLGIVHKNKLKYSRKR